MTGRHGRFLILSLTVCALALMAAAWWYYHRQRETIESAAVNQLIAVADTKTAQIANWRRERIGDGRALAVSPVMDNARRILSGRHTDEDLRVLLAVLQVVSREFMYADAMLVNLDGAVSVRLKAHSVADAEFKQTVRRQLAGEAVKSGGVVLSDLTLDTRSQRPLMALTTPVPGGLGALILVIDPESFLYPYLRSWPAPGRTAETVLFRREGNHELLALNELRLLPLPSAMIRREADTTVPEEAALLTGWVRTERDYRGEPALKITRRIPESPWYLTAKIDQREVDSPISRIFVEMALIMILIAVANGTGVGLIWRSRKLQMHREQEDWFRTVANDTPAFLWMATPDAMNSFVNKPLATFFGVDGQPGLDWLSYVHDEDREGVRSQFLDCLAARRDYEVELRVRRFDGVYRWVFCRAVPRYSPDGNFAGYAGLLTDISERKQAEAMLRSAALELTRELQERTRAEQEVHALTARIIHAQEQERTRVARELHDDICQQIAALSMGVGLLNREIRSQPEALDQSARIQQKLVRLAESTRRVSHELHPALLTHAGLPAALRQHCSEISSLTGVRVALTMDGCLDGLPPDVSLCVYRVAQEALRNVVRHAKVDAARVELSRSEGILKLAVSDQGVGMEERRDGAHTGLGVVSMRERARLVKGTCHLVSRPNEGACLTLTVPVGQTTNVASA